MKAKVARLVAGLRDTSVLRRGTLSRHVRSVKVVLQSKKDVVAGSNCGFSALRVVYAVRGLYY